MATSSTRSRPSTRSCASGFSLLELVIALAVALSVGAGVLALAMSSRSLYETDTARARLNQSLQASKDFLMMDVRQAGERLPSDFPAIQVVQGVGSDPDELILRRNLLDEVMRICEPLIGPTEDRITVAKKTSPPPGCAALPVNPGDEYPPNIQAWKNFRVARGGIVKAYIYNPNTQVGEFFDFEDEDEDSDDIEIIKTAANPDFSTGYSMGNMSRIYLLEERRYRLDADVLQMILNQDPTDPLNLVDSIDDFQVQEVWKAGSGPGSPWTDLATLDIAADGSVELRNALLERDWSLQIMPRNVLSH